MKNGRRPGEVRGTPDGYVTEKPELTEAQKVSLRNRFQAKIGAPKNPDKCVEWRGAKNRAGYGQIVLRYITKKDTLYGKSTHAVWYLTHGVWPKKLLLHTCDNPGCVNVRHLREGDHHENNVDCLLKRRNGKRAKLTVEEAAQVERLYSTGSYSLRDLAASFDVNPTTIRNIVRGVTWRHRPELRTAWRHAPRKSA